MLTNPYFKFKMHNSSVGLGRTICHFTARFVRHFLRLLLISASHPAPVGAITTLVLASWFLASHWTFATFLVPAGDALVYEKAAMSFANGDACAIGSIGMSKTFVIYLYLCGTAGNAASSLFGHAVSAVVIARASSVLVLAWSCWCVGRIGHRLSVQAAWVGVAMFVTTGAIYFYAGVRLPVVFGILGVPLVTLLVLKSVETTKLIWIWMAWLTWSVTCDVRPNALALLPVLMWATLHVARECGVVKRLLGVACGVAIAVAPFALLELATSQSNCDSGIWPLRPSWGLNLFIGNHEDANGGFDRVGTLEISPEGFQAEAGAVAQGASGRPLTSLEANLYWVDRVAEYACTRPADFALGLFTKLRHIVSPMELPVNYDVGLQLRWLGGTPWAPLNVGWLFPLALVGCWFLRRNKDGRTVAAVTGLYGASLVVMFVCADHRLSMLGPVCCLAGSGVVGLVGLALSKRWSEVGILLGVLVGLTAFGSSDRLRWSHQQSYQQLGDAFLLNGEAERAERAYLEAVREKPDYFSSWLRLVEMRGAAGDEVGAREYCARLPPVADMTATMGERGVAAYRKFCTGEAEGRSGDTAEMWHKSSNQSVAPTGPHVGPLPP